MAYDPYSRGSDNPWLGNLDMPRSNPTAKPGASRAASLSAPAKKKKPIDPDLLDPSLRWTNGKITRDAPRRPATGNPVRGLDSPTVPLPPRRPFELTPGAQPMEQAPDAPMPPRRPAGLGGPDVPLPPRRPPELDPVQGPVIPGGLLAPGAGPGAMRPERSTPMLSEAPTPVGAPPGGPVFNGPSNAPSGPPTPMMQPMPDWLKRLLSGGTGNNPGQTIDPNQPSGSIY